MKTVEQKKTDMPYEKFKRFGAKFLTEAELLAVILRTGTKEISAVELGRRILDLPPYPIKGILGLHHISVEQLMKIKGIGEVKAIQVKCIAELSNRIAQANREQGLCFNQPKTVAQYYMEQMRHEDKEQVLVLFLDNKSRLLKELLLSSGSVSSSIVSPRELFIEALKAEAVGFMLLHNHPSGDPTPSIPDHNVTRNMIQCGKMLDIPLIDHIIIGDNKYISFKEAGLL